MSVSFYQCAIAGDVHGGRRRIRGGEEQKAAVILHYRQGSITGATSPACCALACGMRGRGPTPSHRDVRRHPAERHLWQADLRGA